VAFVLYYWERLELITITAMAQPTSRFIVVPSKHKAYVRLLCEVAQARENGRVLVVCKTERGMKTMRRWLRQLDKRLSEATGMPRSLGLTRVVDFAYGDAESWVDNLILSGYPSCGYLLYAGAGKAFAEFFCAVEPLLGANALIMLPSVKSDKMLRYVLRASSVLGMQAVTVGQTVLMSRR